MKMKELIKELELFDGEEEVCRVAIEITKGRILRQLKSEKE